MSRERNAPASPSAAQPIPVLFADSVLLVVDKPSGLAVHRGWARETDVLVARLERQSGQQVFPVHRLDRGTSGVQVLALDSETARRVSDSFAQGLVEKVYWALVRGVAPDEVWIDHAIPASEDKDAPRVAAQTFVKRLRTFGRYSLVEARPKTGRLHQVRRHLKHISCPLIGDVNYGKGEHNRLFRTRYDLHRLFLHAVSLTLPHPRTNVLQTFHAPLSAELERVLEALAIENAESSAV